MRTLCKCQVTNEERLRKNQQRVVPEMNGPGCQVGPSAHPEDSSCLADEPTRSIERVDP